MKGNVGSLSGVFVVFIILTPNLLLIDAWVYYSIYFKRLLLSNEVHTMYKKHSFFLLFESITNMKAIKY